MVELVLAMANVKRYQMVAALLKAGVNDDNVFRVDVDLIISVCHRYVLESGRYDHKMWSTNWVACIKAALRVVRRVDQHVQSVSGETVSSILSNMNVYCRSNGDYVEAANDRVGSHVAKMTSTSHLWHDASDSFDAGSTWPTRATAARVLRQMASKPFGNRERTWPTRATAARVLREMASKPFGNRDCLDEDVAASRSPPDPEPQPFGNRDGLGEDVAASRSPPDPEPQPFGTREGLDDDVAAPRSSPRSKPRRRRASSSTPASSLFRLSRLDLPPTSFPRDRETGMVV